MHDIQERLRQIELLPAQAEQRAEKQTETALAFIESTKIQAEEIIERLAMNDAYIRLKMMRAPDLLLIEMEKEARPQPPQRRGFFG